MADIGQVLGIPTVLKNLAKSQAKIGAGLQRGLKKAGLRLQRESQRIVPVDTGELKGSAFTREEGKGLKTVVKVGYTASHALFVHEAVDMALKGQKRTGMRADGRPKKGKYWDPQGRGQAKFLEEPARRLQPEMRKDIESETVIGLFKSITGT